MYIFHSKIIDWLKIYNSKNKDELIYLGCPYSHESDKIMYERFMAINEIASVLMKHGLYIFSPISHTHPIAEAGDLPIEWYYWEGYDRRILKFCDKILVAKLPGWETSKGVQAEILIGKEFNIPVEYLDIF